MRLILISHYVVYNNMIYASNYHVVHYNDLS